MPLVSPLTLHNVAVLYPTPPLGIYITSELFLKTFCRIFGSLHGLAQNIHQREALKWLMRPEGRVTFQIFEIENLGGIQRCLASVL